MVTDVARGVRGGESWKPWKRWVFERGVAADVSTTRVRGRRSSMRTISKQNLRLDRFDETGHRVLRQTPTSARVDRAEEGFSLERNVLVER